MLLWGGIILDRMGVRFTGILATGLMLLGASVCYYGMTAIPATELWHLPLLGEHKQQVVVCALGFGAFGVGCDITGFVVSKVITRWFKGYELASAMGVQVALARVGTALAISISPLIAARFGLTAPVLLGVCLLLTGFGLFVLYILLLDKTQALTAQKVGDDTQKSDVLPADSSSMAQLWAFCLMIALCVLFYSSIRPFLKFASDVLVQKFSMDSITAGWITSILPYGTIVLTPLFGHLYDRFGRGAWIMFTGCAVTLLAHTLLMLPSSHETWVAVVVMMLLGIAFSLVPSAMWASIPKIVPYKRLGIAYGVIFYIQNIGLMFVPIWIGMLIDAHTHLGAVDYQQPLTAFVLLSLGATFVALLLALADRRYHFGLDVPNIHSSAVDEA